MRKSLMLILSFYQIKPVIQFCVKYEQNDLVCGYKLRDPFLLLQAQLFPTNFSFVTLCERTVTLPVSSSVYSSLQPLFLFSFHSIYRGDGVTSCLPGGSPAASGASPGGGWVKCCCGGWSPLMKYQYFTCWFTAVWPNMTQYRAKWEMSKSVGAVSFLCDTRG